MRPAGVLDSGCLKRGRSLLKKTFLRAFARKSLLSSAFVHATSHEEKDAIEAVVPGCRVIMVPHGTSIPAEQEAVVNFREHVDRLKDRDYILCVSRLHPIKRLDLAVRALVEIRSEHDIGPGDFRK